jgi:hypothetical protein
LVIADASANAASRVHFNAVKEPARADTTGRALHRDPLVVAAIADVDVTAVLRAPHPALRIAIRVVAIPVVAVVVVMVMAVMAVMAAMPVMAVVAVMAVMAVVAVTTVMTMTTSVMAMTPAATAAALGRRVACGGDRRNRQRDCGSSGCEHSTLHSHFSCVDPERPSPRIRRLKS